MDDRRAGTIAAAAGNAGRLAAQAHPGVTLTGEPYTPGDYFPALRPPPLARAELRQKLLTCAAGLGASVGHD